MLDRTILDLDPCGSQLVCLKLKAKPSTHCVTCLKNGSRKNTCMIHSFFYIEAEMLQSRNMQTAVCKAWLPSHAICLQCLNQYVLILTPVVSAWQQCTQKPSKFDSPQLSLCKCTFLTERLNVDVFG